jgi:hypothetical protein
VYVANEYCAKLRHLPVNKHQSLLSSNPISCAMASGSCQSSCVPYDLSSDDEEYPTPDNGAEVSPRQSYRAVCSLTAARLYLNLPPEAPKNWGQIHLNINDYHSDPMEFSSTFWIPAVTDWWRQQEQTHSKYTNRSNVECDIFSIIPCGVGVEASFSLGYNIIGWRQSKTTGETIREKVVIRKFARANNGILAGTDQELNIPNTENNSEMKNKAEESSLHRLANVHDFLAIWQGSQNLHTAQKEFRAQNKQMATVGYISDTEEILKVSSSLFQPDVADAFKLLERSPLPPPLSPKDLPGGQTQILNVHQIRRINGHLVECDKDSTPERILDTEDWLTWNGDLDNSNGSDDDCVVDVESDMEQDNGIENLACQEQHDGSAAPNVPRLIWPIRKSKRQAEKVFVTVNTTKTRRNQGVKKT